MKSPFISFIIPFYNRFTLLKEAVQGVPDSPFKDVEIVLIDDASYAEGLEEILAFIKLFENIIYLRQGENLGPGMARNRGLTAAKGEWIFFMDSDDVIYGTILPKPGCFLVKENGADIIIIGQMALAWPDGRYIYSHGNFYYTLRAGLCKYRVSCQRAYLHICV
jgi:glycosyltransferase involved in cell wall biosynthesis